MSHQNLFHRPCVGLLHPRGMLSLVGSCCFFGGVVIFEITLFVIYLAFFAFGVGFGSLILDDFQLSVEFVSQNLIPLNVFAIDSPEAMTIFRSDGISDFCCCFSLFLKYNWTRNKFLVKFFPVSVVTVCSVPFNAVCYFSVIYPPVIFCYGSFQNFEKGIYQPNFSSPVIYRLILFLHFWSGPQ